MNRLCWNDSFSVGVSELDEHHRRLAELINKLADEVDATPESEAVVDILSALSDYANYHFAREEKLLEQHQYPALGEQIDEHSHFCEIVADACYDATCGDLNLHSLLDYLRHWWVDHILRNDFRYKSFLHAHGVR